MREVTARAARDAAPAERTALLETLEVELARLPVAERQAVILRYLEGRDQEEAAAIAGCPRGTFSRRASDGLARLRQRLAGRDADFSGAALLGLLGDAAQTAVPEALLPSILAASQLAAASVAAGAVGTKALSLAEGARKAMLWAKVKLVASVVAAAAVVGTAVPVTVAAVRGAEPAAVATDKGIACKVTAVIPGGKVMLSAGSTQGVREKFEFDVSREGKKVGAVRAFSVEEQQAAAEVVSATEEIKIGDTARTRFGVVIAEKGPEPKAPEPGKAASNLAAKKFRLDLFSRAKALNGRFLYCDLLNDPERLADIKARADSVDLLMRARAENAMSPTAKENMRKNGIARKQTKLDMAAQGLNPDHAAGFGCLLTINEVADRGFAESLVFGPAVRNVDMEVKFRIVPRGNLDDGNHNCVSIALLDADHPDFSSIVEGTGQSDADALYVHFPLGKGERDPEFKTGIDNPHVVRLVVCDDQGEIFVDGKRTFATTFTKKGARLVTALRVNAPAALGVLAIKVDELLDAPPPPEALVKKIPLTAGFDLRLALLDVDGRRLQGVKMEYSDNLVSGPGSGTDSSFRPLPASAADGVVDFKVPRLTAYSSGDPRRILRLKVPAEMAELAPDPAEFEVDPRKAAKVEKTITLRRRPASAEGAVTGLVTDGTNVVTGKLTVKLVSLKDFEQHAKSFPDCLNRALDFAWNSKKAAVDKDGRFAFDKLAPGEYVVGVTLDYSDMMELPPQKGKLPPYATNLVVDSKTKETKVVDTTTNKQGLTVPRPVHVTVRGGDKVEVNLQMLKKGAAPAGTGQKPPPEDF